MSDSEPIAGWVRPVDTPTDALVVLITAPDGAEAARIAELLVGEALCACVNIVPGVTSIYRWKGAVEQSTEVLCLIKTTRDRYPALAARVVQLHPYEVPEVLALPVAAGLDAYLSWMSASVSARE
jgi:periplasmic divalent cation tolerance protein